MSEADTEIEINSENEEIDYPSSSADDENENDENEDEFDEDDFDEDDDDDAADDIILEFNADPKIQISQRKTSCAICYNTEKYLITDTNMLTIIPDQYRFYDVTPCLDENERLRDCYVILSPCGNTEHVFCVECLRKMLLHSTESLLMQGKGHIRCPFPFQSEPCKNTEGLYFVFGWETLSYILNPVELVYFSQMYERFNSHLRTKDVCTDNFNHVMWSHGKLSSIYFPSLLLQTELCPLHVAYQMENILNDEEMNVKCKECGVYIYKTSDCNALVHCGVQICYVCGYSDILLSPMHWEYCPRFDYHPWWNTTGKCKFLCKQDQCYSDNKICTIKSHQTGIKNMREYRRKAHLKALWQSLPQAIQHEVLNRHLKQDVIDKLKSMQVM